MDKIIALCVGHSRRLVSGRPEGGAVAVDGKTQEWAWNAGLARQIAQQLHDAHGLSALIVDDYRGHGYGGSMRRLGALLAAEHVALAVELHFNSSAPQAHGHEWLHWHSSGKGKLAATQLHLAMCAAFPSIRPRGVKGITIAERGAKFLRETHCPAVIAEPFFGSNQNDFALISQAPQRLARAIAAGLAATLPRL